MDNINSLPEPSRLKSVTTVSKYLALGLFVALPFLGAYVGYQFAPVQIVEIEKIVMATSSNSVLAPTPLRFDYESTSLGQVIQGFEVVEKNEQPYVSKITLRFNEPTGKRVDGTLTAFYTEYTGEYMLRFAPDPDSFANVPYPQNIDAPKGFIVSHRFTDTDEAIDGLCGSDCTPVTSDSDETRDIFVKQASVYVRDIRYEVENEGIDSLGHEIIAEKIEVLE